MVAEYPCHWPVCQRLPDPAEFRLATVFARSRIEAGRHDVVDDPPYQFIGPGQADTDPGRAGMGDDERGAHLVEQRAGCVRLPAQDVVGQARRAVVPLGPVDVERAADEADGGRPDSGDGWTWLIDQVQAGPPPGVETRVQRILQPPVVLVIAVESREPEAGIWGGHASRPRRIRSRRPGSPPRCRASPDREPARWPGGRVGRGRPQP